MGDQSAAEQAKRDAIAKIAASNGAFIETAVLVIEALAARRKEISAMDVWTNYHGPKPSSPRAVGAAFVRAQNLGMIEPTARYVKSGRTSDHNQLLRVWRSRIYTRPKPAPVSDQMGLF